jgi:hypothetical protein
VACQPRLIHLQESIRDQPAIFREHNHEPIRAFGKRAARKLVGVLSRLRLEASQPEMPVRLLGSPMSFFHELQRVRSVTTRLAPSGSELACGCSVAVKKEHVKNRRYRHHRQ